MWSLKKLSLNLESRNSGYEGRSVGGEAQEGKLDVD